MKSQIRYNIIFTLLVFIISIASCTSESMVNVGINNFKFQGSWEVTGLSKLLSPVYREYKNAYMEFSESGQLRLILVFKEDKNETFFGTWEISDAKLSLNIPDLLQKRFDIHLESRNYFGLKTDSTPDIYPNVYFARIVGTYLDKYKDSANSQDNDSNFNNSEVEKSEDEKNEDEKDREGDSILPFIKVSKTSVNFTSEGGESLPIQIETNSDFTVYTSAKWISYNLSNNIISISANKNTGEERSGKVVLTLQGSMGSADIFVIQDASNDLSVVDLGLPSGTKWCVNNLGSSSIEGYGSYYTWTNAKKQIPTGYEMPSYQQASELIRNCSWTWTTKQSVKGYLGKGPNGKTIFLPAGGYYDYSISGGKLVYFGNEGGFWVNYDNTSQNNATLQSASTISFMNSAGVPPKMSGRNQLDKLNVRCVKK